MKAVAAGPRPFSPPVSVPSGGLWLGGIFLALAAVTVFEVSFSQTELLTPIARTWYAIPMLFGFVLGVWTMIYFRKRFASYIDANAALPWSRRSGLPGTMMVVVPLMCMVWLGGLGDRFANHASFFGATADFETHYYPILSVYSGKTRGRELRHNPTITINPFGNSGVKLSISRAQYLALADGYDGLCVAVRQRRSPSGAVQIFSAGSYAAPPTPHRNVRPCSMGQTPA